MTDPNPADASAVERLCGHRELQSAEKQILGSRAAALELLEELVQIRSINPPGEQYIECALLLAERLRDIGFEPRLVQVPAHELQRLGQPPEVQRPSILATLGPDAVESPTLHFHGHYDVVPGDTDDLFWDAGRQRLYVTAGEGFIDVVQFIGERPRRTAHLSSAAGARTSLFVPALGRLYLAVPHRGSQAAEVRVFEARD